MTAAEPRAAVERVAPLGGRTAVVTGASRGIGLAVARSLAGAGARVAMLARGAAALEARAAELSARDAGRAVAVPCDVGDAAAVARAVAVVEARLGGAPDVIVNNAGRFTLAAVEHTSPDDFARALDVNLVAPFLLVRAWVGALRARGGGHLVTIGSIADHHAFPENGAYAAGKFGLRALHEVLRAELSGSGVRATLVSPGPVDTPLWDGLDPDTRPGFTPRARMLAPDAVADAVLFALLQPPAVNVDLLRLSRA